MFEDEYSAVDSGDEQPKLKDAPLICCFIEAGDRPCLKYADWRIAVEPAEADDGWTGSCHQHLPFFLRGGTTKRIYSVIHGKGL